jgi:hypothetical protein
MPRLGSLLLILAAAPVLMFAAHAIACRVLRRAGAAPTAHSSALVALVSAFVPVCALAWRLGAPLCGYGYVAIVYGALAILYIDVVNIAETSLHMHLLLELAWEDGVAAADLLDRYSADRMIAARLDRLTALGQVRIAGGRCHIGNRSTLYFAAAIDAWRVVLGMPTTPPEIVEPSTAGRHTGS